MPHHINKSTITVNREYATPATSKKTKAPSCETCNGLCCRHVATTIDKPTRAWEYDQIRWFLMHEHVTVGIDQDDDWLLEFATDCRHLRPNNRCAIYDTRPKLCRAYPGPDEQCEHDDIDQPAYKICFTNENQFNDYLRKKGKM